MKTFFVIGLQSCLRIFGAFWIFGGFLTFQAARQFLLIDNAMAVISQEKQDKLLSYFLFLSSILTLSTGVALALASRWVFLPLTLLIVSQIIYFAIQKRRFDQAETEEQREDARVESTTINAFKTCLIVAIACGIGWVVGAIK